MAIKIFIDQGHNPRNPNAGAEGNGYREQDITYNIGTELASLLDADPNFEARLSRTSPSQILGTSNATSLANRVRNANSWGADYFISLHTNASDRSSASGSEGFAYRNDSDAFDFGESILTWLNRVTGLANRGMYTRPGLYVLKKTQMPAVLIELGFITNPNDAYLMARNPQLFATGIYNGILDYFGLL